MSDAIYEQAATIPWRRHNGRIEIALITSMGSGRWIIPKGLIDPGETAAQTAVKETIEEAGLHGELSAEPIGEYRYNKWGGTCIVQVYTLKVTHIDDDWLEADERERRWFAIEDAANAVREDDLRELIRSMQSASHY